MGTGHLLPGGGGGLQNGRGGAGQVKFYPYKKEIFEVVLTQELDVLAIVMGRRR